MAQWAKHFPYKHEDQSLDPLYPHKYQMGTAAHWKSQCLGGGDRVLWSKLSDQISQISELLIQVRDPASVYIVGHHDRGHPVKSSDFHMDVHTSACILSPACDHVNCSESEVKMKINVIGVSMIKGIFLLKTSVAVTK